MPDTRGRPLPSEILAALKDASVQNYLRSLLLQVTSSESIGRYPGNGSAQDDQYVYPDAADVNFPYNFDYVIPSNFQRLVSAKLSFRIRAFRSYNTFSATGTGAGTAHAHGNHAHTHGGTHAHGWAIASSGSAVATLRSDGGGVVSNINSGLTDTVPTTAVSPGNTDNSSIPTEAAHTHPISVTSTLGIFEDTAPVNPGITVKVDGVDVTTALGGPFNSDQVEIDVTQVLATGVKLWHTLSLQPNQRVRITGILRVSYYIDSRLAQ